MWYLPLVLPLLLAACEVGNMQSANPVIAGASIIASAVVSCFIAWLILR